MSIGDEEVRRRMVDEGLDPTDPAQRVAFEKTLLGWGIRVRAAGRPVIEAMRRPLEQLLDWLAKLRAK